MKILITESQYDKLIKMVQSFLDGFKYENIDRFEVISPGEGMMHPSITIYFKSNSKGIKRQEIDDTVNEIWEQIYTFFNIPTNIYVKFIY
jgi:hypothetical protein